MMDISSETGVGTIIPDRIGISGLDRIILVFFIPIRSNKQRHLKIDTYQKADTYQKIDTYRKTDSYK
jgi:hypothetical protein